MMTLIRAIFSVFICLLIAACASVEKEAVRSVEIEEIKPRYIEEESFKRIGEYLTGVENKGDRVIVRSSPEQRAGYYFVLVLDTSVRQLPSGTVVEGEFYLPGSAELQRHDFALPARRPKTKEIFLGLTGETWPFDETAVPAAWRFTVKDANGLVLAEEASYLWSL